MMIKTRRMETSDIDQVMEIESVSFGVHHWSPHTFKEELYNDFGTYYSAIDAKTNKLVGYAGLWIIFDEAHITTIASHPSHRGKSIGELLLQKLIERSMEKQAKWITLEVRASNLVAHTLYYKYKFTSLGLRKTYYQDNGEDALIMWTPCIQDVEYQESFQGLVKNLNNKLHVG